MKYISEIIKSFLRPLYVPIVRWIYAMSLLQKILFFSIVAFALLLCVFVVAGYAAVFRKARQKGWKAFIPFYRWVVLLKIVDEKGAKVWLLFVPIFGLIYYYRVLVKLSRAFEKSAAFAAGLFFLPFVFTLILGYDSSECLTAEEEEEEMYWAVMR